jgi:predicted MPP superfamily phosphohydrolase
MTIHLEIGMVAVILLIAVGCYFLLIFPTQWLKVERIHYPCGIGIRVLQISDIHVEKLRISHKRLNRLIRKEKPDYIFLTGDYTEKPCYLSKVARYAEAISSVGVPVFAVLGNHDHRLKPEMLKRLIRTLEKEGIDVLNNRVWKGENFQIVGIGDLSSQQSKIDEAFENVDLSKPIIVITHDPNTVLHINHKYTYLMSGHFHGMQFKIPFLYRFLKKGKLAANGIIKGLHTGDNGTFYISKGMGQAGVNARFLIRSEVTLHEL